MLFNNEKVKYLRTMILICSVLIGIVSTLSVFLYNESNGYELLWILPFIYTIFFICFLKIQNYIYNPGMFIFNIVCIIRYIVTPLLVTFGGTYYGPGRGVLLSNEHISFGIILMIFESICIIIFMYFMIPKFYKDENRNIKLQKIDIKKYTPFKVMVLLALIIIILNPSSLDKFNFFILSSDSEHYGYGEMVSGIGSLILDWTKVIIPLLLVAFFYKQFNIFSKMRYYYLCLFSLLLNLMFFTGISRASAIIPAVVSIFLMFKLFPRFKRRTFIVISISTLFVALSLTFYKSFSTTTGEMSLSLFDSAWLRNFFQIYYSGPQMFGYAIKTKELLGDLVTPFMFLNDLFGNLPIFSRFADLENRSIVLFNNAVYNNNLTRDQVIPTMGQGILYLGYGFSFLFTLCFVFIFMKFDSLYRRSTELIEIYLYAYIAIQFAHNHAGNINILANFVYIFCIPLFLLLLISKYRIVK